MEALGLLGCFQRLCWVCLLVPSLLSVGWTGEVSGSARAGGSAGVRIGWLVVEGRCVAYPFVRILAFTLNGQDHPALRAVLGDHSQCVRVSPPGFEVTVGGRTLAIGPVHLFHPRLPADNGQKPCAP